MRAAGCRPPALACSMQRPPAACNLAAAAAACCSSSRLTACSLLLAGSPPGSGAGGRALSAQPAVQGSTDRALHAGTRYRLTAVEDWAAGGWGVERVLQLGVAPSVSGKGHTTRRRGADGGRAMCPQHRHAAPTYARHASAALCLSTLSAFPGAGGRLQGGAPAAAARVSCGIAARACFFLLAAHYLLFSCPFRL